MPPLKRTRIFIRGQHLFPVNNDSHHTLASMSKETVNKAIISSNINKKDITAVIVGNMLSGILQKQSQLASLVAQSADLKMKDTWTIDCACGSGGSAIRAGIMAILSGFHENVLVVGVEEMKHPNRQELTSALAQASDWSTEGKHGATFVGLNDSFHVKYCEIHQIDPNDFFYFSENAHHNAVTAGHALLRKPVSFEQYTTSKLLGKRVRLFDACPTANGCTAVVLSRHGILGQDPIILGSDCKTDFLTIAKREHSPRLQAVEESVKEVMKQAQILPKDVSVFEAHDAYSIMSALSLESTFLAPGEALKFAKNGNIRLNGQLPMSTFGGLKARGHPVGASGVYQIGELSLQLKGLAGKNQVNNAKIGLTSSFGGAGTTVISHVVGI